MWRHKRSHLSECGSADPPCHPSSLPTLSRRDSPFTQLLQDIKDFLWLLGETVLAQLLQLPVKTERRGWRWWRQRGGRRKKKLKGFSVNTSRVWLLLVSSINLLSSPSIHWLDGCSVLCGQQYKTQRRTVCTHKIKQTKETHFYIWEAGTRESLAFVSIIEKQTRPLACWLLQSPHEADWKT